MDINQLWIKYFDRLSWTSFAGYLKGSWKTSDKIKSFLVLLYTLEEAFRLCYVWCLTDMESSLLFLANFNAIPMAGRWLSLTSGILMFELFLLQSIVWFQPSHVLKFRLYMTHDNQSSFNKESKIIFSISSWLMKCMVSFFHVIVISCGFYYMYYFSFSLSSICFSILGTTIQIINMEIHSHPLMLYSMWVCSFRKLSYSIDSLFIDNSPLSTQLNRFTQVYLHSQALNEESKRISTTCFVFGCVVNTSFFLMIRCLITSRGQSTVPVVILTILASVLVFLGRLIYFVGAATPLNQTIAMKKRVYRILLYDKNLSWKDRVELLKIIKDQGEIRTKMALTTIDGHLLDTKLLGHHIFYSVRVLILLLKIIQSQN